MTTQNQTETTEEKPVNPQRTITPLQATLEAARRGLKQVLPQLRAALDAHPELWQAYGDLGRTTQHGWISLIAEDNLLIRESLYRTAETLKKDLAGPSPTPLERVVVERLVANWLESAYADLQAADPAQSINLKLATFRLQRQESAQRRFLQASKMLATIRRLSDGIRIELRHTNATPAAAAEENDLVRARLKRALRDDPAAVAGGAL